MMIMVVVLSETISDRSLPYVVELSSCISVSVLCYQQHSVVNVFIKRLVLQIAR